MTCGPWRPIYLDVYESRIAELNFTIEVPASLDVAEVVAKADVEGPAEHIEFEVLMDDTGVIVGRETVKVEEGHAETTFATGNPRLWYPRKYGKQPLYKLLARLLSGGRVVDTVSKRFGIRRAKLVQGPLDNASGTSFVFEINNIPVFCGGSNWIPADSFLTAMSPERYHDWVQRAADGNQVMLRVWGGGIYEHDAFYSACDELGILVWQDFMFACGNYPVFPEFLRLVEQEATANIKRLRHHPSIMLWAGNNEDYQVAESEGLGYEPDEQDERKWLQSTFPARYIYERLLVDITAELIPDTYYHFGSPYGGRSTTDPSIGDLHQWNVWHGTQEKYQEYDKLTGRFVSEFGMQALPDLTTVEQFFHQGNDEKERYAESSTVSFHNKAAGHDRRLGIYLTENLRYKFQPLDYYIYCTQLLQAEAVTSAYSAFKRQWKGPGEEYCAGALVWQTNDCWPCTSWSIADYNLRPKLAYYAVKREMEPITIGMKRTMHRIPADNYTGAYVKTVYKIELWVCNLTLETHRFDVSISTANLDTNTVCQHRELAQTLEALPNRSTEVMTFEIPVVNRDAGEELQTVVGAKLTDANSEKEWETQMNWPEPLKYAHLSIPRIELMILKSCEDLLKADTPLAEGSESVRRLMMQSDKPLKGVQIELESQDERNVQMKLNDNGFDVMPDQWVNVEVKGVHVVESLKARVRYLGGDGEEFRDVPVMESNKRIDADTVGLR